MTCFHSELIPNWINFLLLHPKLTSDIKHSINIGGAANGPAPMPLALAVKHALAIPPGSRVRLGEGEEEEYLITLPNIGIELPQNSFSFKQISVYHPRPHAKVQTSFTVCWPQKKGISSSSASLVTPVDGIFPQREGDARLVGVEEEGYANG